MQNISTTINKFVGGRKQRREPENLTGSLVRPRVNSCLPTMVFCKKAKPEALSTLISVTLTYCLWKKRGYSFPNGDHLPVHPWPRQGMKLQERDDVGKDLTNTRICMFYLVLGQTTFKVVTLEVQWYVPKMMLLELFSRSLLNEHLENQLREFNSCTQIWFPRTLPCSPNQIHSQRVLCITPTLQFLGCFTENPTISKCLEPWEPLASTHEARGRGWPLGEVVPGCSQHSLGWANPDPKQEPVPAHRLSLVPGRAPVGWQAIRITE